MTSTLSLFPATVSTSKRKSSGNIAGIAQKHQQLYCTSVLFKVLYWKTRAFLASQTTKNLPTMHEMWIRSLVWEDPLEKWMAAHFSILAWRISWTEEPGSLQSIALQTVRHDWAAKHSVRLKVFYFLCLFFNVLFVWKVLQTYYSTLLYNPLC